MITQVYNIRWFKLNLLKTNSEKVQFLILGKSLRPKYCLTIALFVVKELLLVVLFLLLSLLLLLFLLLLLLLLIIYFKLTKLQKFLQK